MSHFVSICLSNATYLIKSNIAKNPDNVPTLYFTFFYVTIIVKILFGIDFAL